MEGSLVWKNTQAGVCPEGVGMSLGRLDVRLTFAPFLFLTPQRGPMRPDDSHFTDE